MHRRITVRPMDLAAWLLDAHRDLRTRLDRQVVQQVPTDRWHELADQGGSSISWIMLHLARHHDLALNTAIRNKAPLFMAHREALGLSSADTGAGVSEKEQPAVTAVLTAEPLMNYVDDVLAAGERWLQRISAMAFDSIPDTGRRLDRLAQLDRTQFDWLYSMWNGRTVNWFVQWPILGHGQSHVGEAISVRNRLGLSPF